MQRYFFSLRIAALVILAGIAVASVDLAWNGFVVVHDPQGVLSQAAIRYGDGTAQPMRDFARGYWAARPRSDGSIELVCPDGSTVERDYVTPGMRATYTVRASDCGGDR